MRRLDPGHPAKVGLVFLSRCFEYVLGILLGIGPAFPSRIRFRRLFRGTETMNHYTLPTWSSPKRKPSAIALLYRFKTEAGAVKMENDTEFGLAAYFLQPRYRPHLARRRGPRIRHSRHQRAHHLDRDRAIRRHEGKRHRPRRLEIRYRGIFRGQIPLHGRHRPI